MEKSINIRPVNQLRKIAAIVRTVLHTERPEMVAITGILTFISVLDGSNFWLSLIFGIAFFISIHPFTLAKDDYDPDTISDGTDFAEKGGDK